MKSHLFRQEFVELMPGELLDGVLYVSMEYATAIHRCACGCGEKVVTPFSPTDWSLRFDGNAISLSPSIGNWNFPCRSHYWLDSGRVRWAGDMSQDAIGRGRARDRNAKSAYFNAADASLSPQEAPPASKEQVNAGIRERATGEPGIWATLKEWWRR